jgi:glycosidase
MDLWDYLFEVLENWVSLGVDGFRCDVASLVPLEFWKLAREKINQKKEVIWLAETLDLHFLKSLRDMGYYIYCDSEIYQAFDLTYDYDGYDYLRAYFRGEKSLEYYLDQIYLQETMLPNGSLKMRFLENHDNPRIASVLNGKDKIKNWTAFYMLLPGSNLIYAGQELMIEKLPNLFEKDPIKWDKGDYEFLSFFKKIISLSKDIKSKCSIFNIEEISKGIVKIEWSGYDSEYIAILNLEDRYGEIPVDFNLYATDLLTNEIFSIDKIFKIRKLPLIFKIK